MKCIEGMNSAESQNSARKYVHKRLAELLGSDWKRIVALPAIDRYIAMGILDPAKDEDVKDFLESRSRYLSKATV